jgi:hydroxyacylglutathione hydrolase
MLEIIPIDTPSLGDRSYLAHDGEVVIVVDPQRDIDRILALTEPRGLRITHVFETHIHNDYVTGGLALARATAVARKPVSCRMTVGTHSTPARNATMISQKVQRHRRNTPMPSSTMKLASAASKTIPNRRQLLCLLDAFP